MKPHRTTVVAVVGVLALTACQGSRDTKDVSGSAGTSSPRQASGCDLLSDEQRMELIGVATPEAEELPGGCFWTGPDGPNSFHVSVSILPASEWAAEEAEWDRVSLDHDVLSPADRRKHLRSARLLESVGNDDERACGVFVQLGELDGAAPGSRTLIRVTPPIADLNPGGVAERCVDGTHTRLGFSAPGLRENEMQRSARATLDEISPIVSSG